MALGDVLLELEAANVSYRGEIAPRIHAYATERAMSRVRSYQTAGLQPIAARGPPVEVVLLAHVHEDAAGKVERIEGFNGTEGERLAERLRLELGKRGLLPPGALVRPNQPLRECAASARTLPPRR